MTAYNECELWVDEMLEYVYDNFTYFDEFLKENLPHIHLVKPEGLYLCWVDFRECGLDKDELEKTMLEKAGLMKDISLEQVEKVLKDLILQFQEVF